MGSFRVGVLASGEGTNLQAILDRMHGHDGIEVVAVGGDRDDARALERARAAGIATAAFGLGEHGGDRATRDAAMAAWLHERGVQLVVLAGYMQLLTTGFLAAFPSAVINVHPALLPAFPGLRAVEQAIAHGVRVVGVTVHFVDDGVDTGPIILQRAVELPTGATGDDARALLRPLEHDLLPQAVRLLAAGAARVDDDARRVHIDHAEQPTPAALDHVLLAAPDGCVPAARRFFGELLGLPEIERPASMGGEGVWFGCGAQQIHIGAVPEGEHAPARKAHPALRLPDPQALDALAERLRAAGAPVRHDTRLPGERRFYTEDPWGNRIELLARAAGETGGMLAR